MGDAVDLALAALAAHGITCFTRSELEALANQDARLIAAPALATPGAVWRLVRWLDGRPAASLARLSYVGSDDVREIVVDTISKLPAPVAYHAVEAVQWFEVGCGTKAWTCAAPAPRALPRDRGHIVLINGRLPSLYIPGVVCHELGHSWLKPVSVDEPKHDTIPERDALARLVGLLKQLPPDIYAAEREKWITERVREEARSDELAELWGMPHDGADEELLREVGELVYKSAEELADSLRVATGDAELDRAAALERGGP